LNTITKFAIASGIIIAIIITSQADNHGLLLFSSNGPNDDIKTNIDNSSSKTLRIGYFPNVNHAQAIIGLKNGDFQKILNSNDSTSKSEQNKININEFVFSDGPSALEALFGGQIDVAYVGPNPAISGYVASGGKDGLRIISGAASGGASFVVRNDAGIQSVKDLGGKKFASPQLGNTQDVSLRKYLVNNGYKTAENGGNVTVVPTKPSDIFTLMLKKQIDGAWVPEPWATRLVNEANGKIFVDERDLWPPKGKFVTANIIVRTDYLNQNPDVIKKLLEAHVNETLWINNHLNSDKNNSTFNDKNINQVVNAFNNGLKKMTGKTISDDELKQAFSRMDFTYDPLKQSLYKIANDANSLGFISNSKVNKLNITGIYNLQILNSVLKEKGLGTID
jgi:NitT/TauT family transport system substrate-binding protein